MSDILVYALHYEGAFNSNSLGAVSEGARLARALGGRGARGRARRRRDRGVVRAAWARYGAARVLPRGGP